MNTQNPIEILKDWQIADPQLIMNKLTNELRRKPNGRWVFTENFSPLDLYIYLKARFGPANGFQMALKHPSSDNLIHWHWTLQLGDNIMDFLGCNMHAEVLIEGFKDFSEADGIVFEKGIKKDFKNYGTEMSKVRKEFEKWNLFVNPYNRLYKLIKQFSKELRALSLDKLSLPDQPHTSEEMDGYKSKFDDCCKVYIKAFGLSTSIRMLAPVLAEAFINLVIFLLAKDEIKRDKRIYDNVLRTEIDVRVKSLHLNCKGFSSPIPSDASEFMEFHNLMNSRNDFLHGNIDPIKLKYDVIYFDKNIPLPRKYKSFSEIALINSLIHVEPEKVLHDVQIVDNFINLVLSQMRSEVAEVIQMFMETTDPGWREDTMKAGILFPPYMVDFILIHGPRVTNIGDETNKNSES